MNAINAYNKLNANVAGLKKASEKLASGYRINRAGDDAAGLAISEKMRSQIRGLNQAVRNSQDGINMIQTFEGAAQETHNILQRMKELAMESANGTYDNSVDRAAIQLEFEQLNDELNQIADTDFNGTIVLNGGVMADGLKAVDGEFDYANKAGQVADANAAALAALQEAAQKAIDKAEYAYGKAYAEYQNTNFDLSSNGMSSEYNTIDQNKYTKAMAEALWKDLGIDESDATKVEITFEFDGTNWKASVATSNASDKATYSDDDLLTKAKALTVTDDNVAGTDTATGYGGFSVSGTNMTDAVNAIFDASEAKSGDTFTLVFTKEAPTVKAPTNVGAKLDSVKNNAASGGALTFSTGNNTITDEDMTENVRAMFEALDGIEMRANKVKTNGADFDEFYIGGTKITAAGGAIDLTDPETGELIYDKDGNKVQVWAELAGGKVTLSTVDNSGAQPAKGKVFAEITIADADANADTGDVIFNFAVDKSAYEEGAGSFTVRAGDDPNLGTSTEAKAKLAAAKAALDAAKAAFPTELPESVTKPDAYDNSTAKMTYSENIVLQTGARTKDAVNFTFSYNRDGTADMGNLIANLNLSSREDGLNTASLSLANQKDANYAIDQIDKAINKTSMVRATFGAIQNRLEHKITNLTTTSENLTEAESAIRDTDMAQEMMNYTKFNILQQAAQSMLAQANQQPQSILQLLG